MSKYKSILTTYFFLCVSIDTKISYDAPKAKKQHHFLGTTIFNCSNNLRVVTVGRKILRN